MCPDDLVVLSWMQSHAASFIYWVLRNIIPCQYTKIVYFWLYTFFGTKLMTNALCHINTSGCRYLYIKYTIGTDYRLAINMLSIS